MTRNIKETFLPKVNYVKSNFHKIQGMLKVLKHAACNIVHLDLIIQCMSKESKELKIYMP